MAADEPELLRAIIDAPDEDDEPLLVYLDWLLERGDPRGEWLRLELARASDAEQRREIDERRAALLTRRTEDHERLMSLVEHAEHARALVRKVTLRLDTFAAHGEWILDRFPVRTFEFIALSSAEIRGLAATPALARVHTLAIGNPLSATNATILAASPHLALRGLELGSFAGAPGLGRDGLRAFATAPGMTRCAFLALTDASLTGAIAELVALPALTTLELHGSRLDRDDQQALGQLGSLTSLDLVGSAISHPAIEAIARLPDLRKLALGRTTNANAFAPLLAGAWPALRELILSELAIEDDFVAELVRAPFYARLERLRIEDSPIGNEGAIAIASAAASRSLRRLELPRCEILGRGETALNESPHLGHATIDLGLHRRY